MRTSIETTTGLYFDFADPRAEDVCIEDIAAALSKLCRFNGHVSRFYSVAEHAVLVHDLVAGAGGSDEECFAALHHDSGEAYYNDITTPLKKFLGAEWRAIRESVDEVVAGALGIEPSMFHHPAIKVADTVAMRAEAVELKKSKGQGWGAFAKGVQWPANLAVYGLTPNQAHKQFLRVHREYA